MAQEDATKIISFHQAGYDERYATILRGNEEKYEKIYDSLSSGQLLNKISHYTKQTIDTLKTFQQEVDALLPRLNNELVTLSNDVAILKKYVGFFHRY